MSHTIHTMTRGLLLLVLCLQAGFLFSQLNMKAGFTSLYTPATQFNAEVNAFNEANAERLQNPIPELHFLNGLQVGVRYTFDRMSTDLTWENTLRKRVGFGEDPDTKSLFEREYFYNFNALSFNLEAHLSSSFHFSVGVGRRNLRIRREINGSNKRIDIFDTPRQHYFVQVKPIFILSPRSKTPLAITPFFLYPISLTDVTDFKSDIGLSNSEPVSDRFMSFGLSIVYYYGSQLD